MSEAQQDRPVINIEGELVALGPFHRDLLPIHHRWENDFQIKRTDDPVGAQPRTLDEVTRWYDDMVKNESSHRISFAVYERATWRPIGLTALHGIEVRNRTAEFGITIGEPDCRGKGYGTEATQLTLDYAFTVLGLHNVMLTTVSYNLAAQGAYAKAGFREFGRRRESVLMAGRMWDDVFMDCLAGEFQSPVLSSVYVPDVLRPT
jgi:RimJ/RimL family protein N-acetyltransferase